MKMQGMPDCMYRKEPGEAPRRVRLVMSCGYSCFVSAASAMEYAKACAAYAAGLMAKGYDVAITAIQAIADGSDVCIMGIQVKDYGVEPDASRIAFSAHPAFLRRAMFAAEELDTDLPTAMRNYGYGTPCFDTTRGKEYATAIYPDSGDERTITLPPLTKNGITMQKHLELWETQAIDSQVSRDATDLDKQVGAK